MVGNGNSLKTLLQKLWFFIIPTARQRTQYIYAHKAQFAHIGDNLFFQPRNFPADPELIRLGNNVQISANVSFICHDLVHKVFNGDATKDGNVLPYWGCIEVGDNVLIGAGVRIMPNVRIGCDCIIAAGAVVTKDIPDRSVVGGGSCALNM